MGVVQANNIILKNIYTLCIYIFLFINAIYHCKQTLARCLQYCLGVFLFIFASYGNFKFVRFASTVPIRRSRLPSVVLEHKLRSSWYMAIYVDSPVNEIKQCEINERESSTLGCC